MWFRFHKAAFKCTCYMESSMCGFCVISNGRFEADCSHFLHLFSLRDFAKTIKRPFSVYYNPYTQSIDLLKDTRSIENVVQDLRSDLTTVCDALGKMNTYMGI